MKVAGSLKNLSIKAIDEKRNEVIGNISFSIDYNLTTTPSTTLKLFTSMKDGLKFVEKILNKNGIQLRSESQPKEEAESSEGDVK